MSCERKVSLVILISLYLLGRRSDEASPTLVVGHVGLGPHTPTYAQQPARRDHPPQRTEVRSAQFRPPRCAQSGGPFQRHHSQAAGVEV